MPSSKRSPAGKLPAETPRGTRSFDRPFNPRGGALRDHDALADVLVRVSDLTCCLGNRLAALDINRLLVRPRGQGVVAADALIVLR